MVREPVNYIVKTNTLKTVICSVIMENLIFLNTFIFKICLLYLDTGS